MSEQITFNVGGRTFTMAKKSWEKGELFRKILAGETPATKDANGHFQVNRNPRHMALVLKNFVCTVNFFPKNEAEIVSFIEDLKFFGFTELIEKANNILEMLRTPETQQMMTLTNAINAMNKADGGGMGGGPGGCPQQ